MNSFTEMTSADDLCAEDGDSSPQDLAYWVTTPSNGHLALKSFPSQSIQNFSQAQINEGQLVFVHAGSVKPLSSHDLKAVTNDVDSAGNRTITFPVISSPRLRRLVRLNSDSSTEEVSVFTQYLVSSILSHKLKQLYWEKDDNLALKNFICTSKWGLHCAHDGKLLIKNENDK
nr:chondroitin sulfate proteoglycan 4-like isoform X1 [Pongo abelii]